MKKTSFFSTIGAQSLAFKSGLFSFILLSICIIGYTAEQRDASSSFSENKDLDLIDSFIKSKEQSNSIVFDSRNIKQFWIDKSVASRNENILISLKQSKTNDWESIPLKFQLINVSEGQDCTVEIITENPDLSFFVLDSKFKELSSSQVEDDFIQYHVLTSTFHLEDTDDFSFSIKFKSDGNDLLSIKKIMLSFSNNPETTYFASPGNQTFEKDDILLQRSVMVSTDNSLSYRIKGQRSIIKSKNSFFTSDNKVRLSATVKNVGTEPTNVNFGFIIYNKKHIQIAQKDYPYKAIGKTLEVIKCDAETKSIEVDNYPEWGKGCNIALNAKEDLSDIPNGNIASYKVSDVKKLDNGHAIIVVDNPINNELKTGDRIRLHVAHSGGAYSLPAKKLMPGDVEEFFIEIQKDDELLEYSLKAFPRGVYFFKAMILSYSVDPNNENEILVSDFKISY